MKILFQDHSTDITKQIRILHSIGQIQHTPVTTIITSIERIRIILLISPKAHFLLIHLGQTIFLTIIRNQIFLAVIPYRTRRIQHTHHTTITSIVRIQLIRLINLKTLHHLTLLPTIVPVIPPVLLIPYQIEQPRHTRHTPLTITIITIIVRIQRKLTTSTTPVQSIIIPTAMTTNTIRKIPTATTTNTTLNTNRQLLHLCQASRLLIKMEHRWQHFRHIIQINR